MLHGYFLPSGKLVEVSVLREIPEDPHVVDSWNELVMRLERPEIFFTHEWALAASRAFSDTVRPLVFLAYDAQRLCGIASLATHPESTHTAFFLNANTADYCDILTDPANRSQALVTIFSAIQKSGIENLVLANVPSDSPTLRELPRIAESLRYHLHSRAAYDCGLILFGGDEERQAILQSVRRKDREKRGLKKMAQLGSVRLTHLATEQAEMDLTPMFSAQISRFLATGRISPLVLPERRSFLTQLSRLLGQAGWLKISRLEVNGQPVAWNYGSWFCGSWFWYLPTFEPQYEHLSPGSCLLRLLVEEGCADQSVERLDLGLGDEAYKERFANSVCPTRYVHLSTSALCHGTIAGRHWLAHAVQRFPRIEVKIREARDLSRDLRGRIRHRGPIRTAAYACQKATKYLASDDEMLLFQAPPIEAPSNQNMTLFPLDWKQVASAAISNANDSQTLQYLMRCAGRLREGTTSGFVLRENDVEARHFLWVDNYDGFHLSEIDHKIEPSDPGASMIFDCWTPAAHRGQGYYATAIRSAAALLEQQERRAWIFSAAENTPSVRGICKAGFVYRFSLVRKRRLGHSSVAWHDKTSSIS